MGRGCQKPLRVRSLPQNRSVSDQRLGRSPDGGYLDAEVVPILGQLTGFPLKFAVFPEDFADGLLNRGIGRIEHI